ncbi:hypothetical protein PAL_GLEAN10011383 [Pteropus alecto]|uniref:Uncharacterized protein n=1 Tax=Pteropus alecto TaxID=9402 RepID=L5KQ87_PTEAL|nr:hypothetical protein PAL_GLEAN10011383 [Pteropus alecto]
MSVSTQQLAEEMQIFGLEYEEPLIEKCTLESVSCLQMEKQNKES